MTIAEPGMFLVWAVLSVFAAVALGATITVFIYERRIRHVERINEVLDAKVTGLYERLIEQANAGPPQLDEALLEETKRLKQRTVSTVETGGWTPDPEHVAEARRAFDDPAHPFFRALRDELDTTDTSAELERAVAEGPPGESPHFRVGMKLHTVGCPHLVKAIAPQHLWAFTVDELHAMVDDAELHTCKTCKPLEEDSKDVPQGALPEGEQNDGDDGEQRAEPSGGAAGLDEPDAVGGTPDGDRAEDVPNVPGPLAAEPVYADSVAGQDQQPGRVAHLAGGGLRGAGDEPGARERTG